MRMVAGPAGSGFCQDSLTISRFGSRLMSGCLTVRLDADLVKCDVGGVERDRGERLSQPHVDRLVPGEVVGVKVRSESEPVVGRDDIAGKPLRRGVYRDQQGQAEKRDVRSSHTRDSMRIKKG